MIRYLIIACCSLMSLPGWAQTTTFSESTTFTFKGKNYTMKVERNGDKSYEVELGKSFSDTQPEKFSLFPISMQSFANGFISHFQKLVPEADKKEHFKSELSQKAREMFFLAVQATYVVEETGPLAGELSLHEEVCVQEVCGSNQADMQQARLDYKDLFARKLKLEQSLIELGDTASNRASVDQLQKNWKTLRSIRFGDNGKEWFEKISKVEQTLVLDAMKYEQFSANSIRLKKAVEALGTLREIYEEIAPVLLVENTNARNLKQLNDEFSDAVKQDTALGDTALVWLVKKLHGEPASPSELVEILNEFKKKGQTSKVKGYSTLTAKAKALDNLQDQEAVRKARARKDSILLVFKSYEKVAESAKCKQDDVELSSLLLCTQNHYTDSLQHRKGSMAPLRPQWRLYKGLHALKELVNQLAHSPQRESILQKTQEVANFINSKNIHGVEGWYKTLLDTLAKELELVEAQLSLSKMEVFLERGEDSIRNAIRDRRWCKRKMTRIFAKDPSPENGTDKLLDRGWVREKITVELPRHQQSRSQLKKLKALRSQWENLQNLINQGGNGECIPMKVEDVQIEFQEGYIENIRVVGWIRTGSDSTKMIFENLYPIGFSSERNFNLLSETKLFSIQDAGCPMSMQLGRNLLVYEHQHANDRRDYSPRNMTVTWEAPLVNEELYKAPTRELIEGRVFSDFVGINEDNPNGLVQLEIGKRFNVYHNRRAWTRNGRVLNASWFNYLYPSLMIAKIEENKRFLPLGARNQLVNGQLYSSKYASTIDLFNFRNLDAGIDFNILSLDAQLWKSTFHINAGFHTSLTPLLDTLYTLGEGNQIQPLPNPQADFTLNLNPRAELLWQLFQEERYGGTLNLGFNYLYMISNVTESRGESLLQIGDPEIFQQQTTDWEREKGSNRFFWTLGMKELYYRPSEDNKGKLFFRYQFHFTHRFFNESFHQVQLGYSYYILTAHKK